MENLSSHQGKIKLDRHLKQAIFPVADRRNIVRFEDWRITVLAPCLFRIEKDTAHLFTDEATQTVIRRDFAPVLFSVRQGRGYCKIETECVTLHVREPLSKSYVILDGKKVYLNGKGNLLGTYRTLDFCDGAVHVPDQKRIGLCSGVCSVSGVALLDDVHSLILAKDGTIVARRKQEADTYVFAFGHDYRNAVRALYEIAGQAPLLPKFVFGNWWSRYYPYTQAEYLRLLDRFEENGIPLSVAVIDMDWHYSDHVEEELQLAVREEDRPKEGIYGWTGYTWNRNLFPDYKVFLREVKERGLAVALNVHPKEGVRFYEDAYPAMCAATGRDPESKQAVPFDFTDNAFINAYFRILHRPYEQDGVRFWWIDWQQGTQSALAGLDPLWALNHYHFLDNAVLHDRPLILSRYAGVGSHRYPIGFSGDNVISWASLAYLPYFTATASNVGFGWWSHDIGMHMLGSKSYELYVRSIQYGAFLPVNRIHNTSFPTLTKEPSYYMNGAGGIAVRYLRLRHRMIPFLYSAAYYTHTEARQLIEPMYYDYPEYREAYRYRSQHMFGGQLLVAPVTSPSGAMGLAKKRVWLPPGDWTDIFTGQRYEGGRILDLYRWLDDIPVLAKEGSIFVLSGETQGHSLDNPRLLEADIFNGNGSFTLYEDTGNKTAFTYFRTEGEKGVQRVTLCFTGEYGVVPEDRTILLRFRNIDDENAAAYVDGKRVEISFSGCPILRIQMHSEKTEIEVRFNEKPKMARILERALDSLTRFEGDTLLICRCYEKLKSCKVEEEFAVVVRSLDLPKIYREKLLEI